MIVTSGGKYTWERATGTLSLVSSLIHIIQSSYDLLFLKLMSKFLFIKTERPPALRSIKDWIPCPGYHVCLESYQFLGSSPIFRHKRFCLASISGRFLRKFRWIQCFDSVADFKKIRSSKSSRSLPPWARSSRISTTQLQ